MDMCMCGVFVCFILGFSATTVATLQLILIHRLLNVILEIH